MTKSAGTSPEFPSVVGVTFNDMQFGSVQVAVGTLWLQGGGTFSATQAFSGTLSVNDGTSLGVPRRDVRRDRAAHQRPLFDDGDFGPINFRDATVNFTGPDAVYSQFGDTMISGGSFNYAAPTTAQMGTLTISGDDTQVVIGGGSTLDLRPVLRGTLTQTGGEFDLEGGTVIAPLGYNLEAGTFNGSGTIKGAVTNGGAIFPGGQGTAGKLTISDSSFTAGTYTQTSTGSIDFDIGGTSPGNQYDQVVATSNANSVLNGALNLKLIDGFSPAVGDSFTILTGSFDYRNFTFSEPTLGVGKGWQPIFRNFDVTFQVVTVGGFGVSLTPSNANPSYGQPDSFTARRHANLGRPAGDRDRQLFHRRHAARRPSDAQARRFRQRHRHQHQHRQYRRRAAHNPGGLFRR